MPGNTSILDMIISASLIVQLVMALLFAASITSWAIIVRKRRVLGQAVAGSDAFESSFWSGGDLSAIYRDVTQGGEPPSAMAGLFEAGFREFRRLTEQPGMAHPLDSVLQPPRYSLSRRLGGGLHVLL